MNHHYPDTTVIYRRISIKVNAIVLKALHDSEDKLVRSAELIIAPPPGKTMPWSVTIELSLSLAYSELHANLETARSQVRSRLAICVYRRMLANNLAS